MMHDRERHHREAGDENSASVWLVGRPRLGLGRIVAVLAMAIGLTAVPVRAQLMSPGPADWGEGAESTRSMTRSAATEASLAHVVDGPATLYNRSDSTAPVQALPVRTPVHRLSCDETWCRVRTDQGRTGYVPKGTLSDVWIRVSKKKRRLYLYHGPELVDVFRADVGYNSFSDKRRRGSLTRRDDWRTPEGVFYIVNKRPRSDFYKAFVLNYPKIRDAERGLEQGLISRSEYEAIVRAQKERRRPPMNTKLGGWIEIHGEGTGSSTNWTQGCIAVQNRVMNELWVDVEVGTPVLIE